ncbi:acyl-CoA thioesterase [Halovulum dunhuangense]|uniref:Acyl-CoA thioesterase n=1 Tax=Halovulum dunhuangense TaxID=1505036 RepID=A0A849L5L5_9RHOB|nr:thioesterase family protein [Halovulum dunhuangense]NNU81421.1 acyl-CoA thioesterase [Halovulum dunhuangense]
MPRPRKTRTDYAHFARHTTRWRDNDVYGHMNNAVFYELVDAAVNDWIIGSGELDIPHGPVVGLVVESACVFHESLGWPDPVDAGLRVARIGNSSVQYEVGLFRGGADHAAAEARFVHVYVDRDSRRPVSLPDPFRSALARLQVA